MVRPKIPQREYVIRLNKVNSWIAAMTKLLYNYQDKLDPRLEDCPLCNLVGINADYSPVCDQCIWVEFTGDTCHNGWNGRSCHFAIDDEIYLTFRISQLKSWISEYKRRRRYLIKKIGDSNGITA
jgi:hypothetical protein